MKGLALSRHHDKLTYELSILSKPLNALNITGVTYLKNYYDGTQINISTFPGWVNDYYNLELYKSSRFESDPRKYTENFFLWSSQIDKSDVILLGRDKYNSDFGLTIIKKSKTFTEFYFISGAKNSPWMHNILLNNLDLLQYFILSFRDNFNIYLDKLTKSSLPIKKLYVQTLYEPSIVDSATKEKIRKTMPVKRLVLESRYNELVRLSYQQTRCIKALYKYKTIPLIASNLGLREKTVESYFDTIKFKLGCQNKNELFEFLLHLKATLI